MKKPYSSRIILKIKKLILLKFSILLKPYFNYRQSYWIRKRKLILNLKRYFSSNLYGIKYNTLSGEKVINFDMREKKFLEEQITCLKAIKNYQLKPVISRGIFTCEISDVIFYGASGGFSFKKKIIVESLMNLERVASSNSTDSVFYKHRKLNGNFTSITFLPWTRNNIFHWLIECLPRFYGITKLSKDFDLFLIVNRNISTLQIETLRFFLTKSIKIIFINPNEVWNLQNFYFSSFCSDDCSGFMPKQFLDFVKKKIIKGYGINKFLKKRRIYISRDKASKRKLKNEHQFYELIKNKFGFERIYAEDLPFRKQVELFHSTEIIIGVHGAGLANIVFSENLKIIEIHPPKEIKTHYFMLSKALNVEYRYIIGEDQDKNDNFEVNLSKFSEILKQLGI